MKLSSLDKEDIGKDGRNWQDKMFERINEGDTVKEAFDYASVIYEDCEECVGFAGDEDFAIMPQVIRQGVKGRIYEVNCDIMPWASIYLRTEGKEGWCRRGTYRRLQQLHT